MPAAISADSQCRIRSYLRSSKTRFGMTQRTCLGMLSLIDNRPSTPLHRAGGASMEGIYAGCVGRINAHQASSRMVRARGHLLLARATQLDTALANPFDERLEVEARLYGASSDARWIVGPLWKLLRQSALLGESIDWPSEEFLRSPDRRRQSCCEKTAWRLQKDCILMAHRLR
jgi:hypothetical protein